MPDADDSGSPYDDARRHFEGLEVEEQTRFLVEATATTLARGIREAGDALADGLEDAIRTARRSSNSHRGHQGPGAAEPETAQRHTPRGGASGD